MSKICTSCKSEMPAQAKFCSNCGKQLPELNVSSAFNNIISLYEYVSEPIEGKVVCANYHPPYWEACFINRNGETLKEQCILEQIGDFYILNFCTLLNKEGAVVEKPQNNISYHPMKEHLNVIYKSKDRLSSCLYGLIDSHTGEELLPPEYPDFEELTNSIVMIDKNGFSGIFNYETGLSVPCCYEEITEYIDEEGKEYFIASKKSDDGSHIFYGVIDRNNKEIVPFIYERISELYGKGLLLTMNGYTALSDIQGRMHFPFKYNEIVDSGEGLCVKKGDYWGMVTMKDEVIIPFEYEKAFWFGENGFARVYKNNKAGVIDLSNNIIIPFIFYRISEPNRLKTERPECETFPTPKCNGWGRIFINQNLDVRFDLGDQDRFYEWYPDGHRWFMENKEYLGRIWQGFGKYEEITPERFESKS